MNLATGTYFDGQSARGRTVTLEFSSGTTLRLTGEGLAEDIDLARLRVSDRLGEVPRFLYLPGDATIETSDNTIIDAVLGERQQSRGSRLIHTLESQQRIAVAACFLVLATIGTLGYFGPPVLARAVAQRVPTEIDQRIGTAALVTMRPYFGDSGLTARERGQVQTQLTRLSPPNSPRPHPRIEFRSMNGGLPNAFALPGNVIIVTDELVRLPASDDEIAAVLAHELGHLEKRHGLQSLLRGSFAVLIVASVTGDLSALTSFAGTIPLTILTAGYSRELEREADLYALALLRSRGINPQAFTTALVKLEASRASLNRNSTYLSTHPATEERTALFGKITDAERKAALSAPAANRAADAMKAHDYETALTNYTRVIETAPSALAYLERARCNFQSGKNQPAASDLAHALELNPASLEARVLQAEVLAVGEKKYDEAIVAAQKALALDPKNAGATATLGYAETRKGDLTAALTHLNRAIELDRADFHGWGYRGYLHEQRNDPAAALADYNEALRREPKTQWVRFSRGTIRSRQKDFAGALTDFAAVDDPSWQSASLFLERGVAQQALGRFKEAIADYGRALDKKSDKAMSNQVHLNRGIAFGATGNYKSALADFDVVIEADPKHGAAYYQRAYTRRRMGSPAQALIDLDRAAQAGVPEPVILRERAELDWDLERYADAIRDFDRVLAQGADAHAYQARGLLEFSLGQLEQAEADLDVYLKTAKPRPEEYVEFFSLLTRRLRKEDDRQAAFTAKLGEWPEGWAKTVGRYLSGRITEARLLDETYSDKPPTRDERLCEAYFYIGIMRQIAGDRTAAEDFFQKCVRTDVKNYYEYKLARAELILLRKNR